MDGIWMASAIVKGARPGAGPKTDRPAALAMMGPQPLDHFRSRIFSRDAGGADYATVAMRFALKDSMVERASGRTVEGGERSEVTELWTFMRARGGNWLLSAIQQT
jgi:Tim44-like domain